METYSSLLFTFPQPGTAITEIDDSHQPDQAGPQQGKPRAGCEIARGHFRIRRQTVNFRFVHQQIERVEPAENLFIRTVKIRPLLAGLLQLLDALLCPVAQIADRSKLDRLGRAGLRASRLQPALEPIVTKRALLRR